MEHRELGSTGLKPSVISLGTWVMGGWMWGGTIGTPVGPEFMGPR